MATSIALDSRQLALELHALLRDIDPARWRDEVADGARDRLAQIEDNLAALVERSWPDGTLQARLRELLELLRTYAPPDDLTEAKASWMAFRAQAQPAYESLAACLRDQGTHVPSLRPTNYIRNVFHVLNAVWVLVLVEEVLVPTGALLWVALGGAIWAWSMEIGRRLFPQVNTLLMRVFSRVAHPHEAHRVNSATWYASALVVLALWFEVPAGVAALAVLGLGDPVAAIVGRRLGRVRLVNGRTLEGSLAFVLAGSLAAALALGLWSPEPWPQTVAIATTAAMFGAVAELFARRVDDNFAIPVAAAVGATVAASWLL